jgi:NAD-dependent DNA ligase
VRTSVSGKLDYLIVGENAGSKKSKADDLGVKCIDLSAFMVLIS